MKILKTYKCSRCGNSMSVVSVEYLPAEGPDHNESDGTTDWLPKYFLEQYPDSCVMIGYYRDQSHLEWILGDNGKKTLAYNVRLKHNPYDLRDGAHSEKFYEKKNVKFVVLYTDNYETTGDYRVYLVKDSMKMAEGKMAKAHYPSTVKGDYYLFNLYEEINLGTLDIKRLIELGKKELMEENEEWVPCEPLFVTCRDILRNGIRISKR